MNKPDWEDIIRVVYRNGLIDGKQGTNCDGFIVAEAEKKINKEIELAKKEGREEVLKHLEKELQGEHTVGNAGCNCFLCKVSKRVEEQAVNCKLELTNKDNN